ncbi:MFS transporter [Amycolatopsis cynarae]|uniref:MFS transporter n=1 Tax=Amycolatopsis cynarae TaxID=2995223 RepID=A0ABY7BCI9_9PSEU|nr:MFS transporter [Amycolatopsis sp. HUAS 11-8]WAL68962.1 MFS transporter [Amycolatopsis sp. HUAS 11-8]
MIATKNWVGVWLLALGTFVVGTDAHSVAGLLPDMAASLRSSVSVVGQSVTVFAIAYAVSSPTLTVMLSTRGPHTVLTTALILFAVGNIATAVSLGVPSLLIGRVVAAAGAALFTPTAGAVAVGLVGTARRGTALAIVTAGASSALVLGAPAGAALAAVTSWRVTLLVIAVLGVLVLPVLRFVPTEHHTGQPLAQRFSVLRTPQVRTTLGVSLLAFAGVFVPYTYMSQAYSPLIAVVPGGISIVLLMFGLTSVVGALSSGPLADRVSARWMVVAATGALAVVDAAAVAGRGAPALLAVTLLLAGYLSWSILAPQQQQLVTLAPDHAAVLISFNAAAGYLGISLSGVVGGVALGAIGPARFTLVACVLLASAALWRSLPVERTHKATTRRPTR